MLTKDEKKNQEKEEYDIDISFVSSPFRLKDTNSEKIKQIKIDSYCMNMEIFDGNFNFINLKKLSLKNNNINDISILTNFDFSNLEKINLNSNHLDDKMIDKINKIKAPNLKSLNLSFNYFTDYKLFKSIEHFENLEIFKMESNPFNENVNINEITDEYNFLSMKNLYLFNGIFCNETIGLLAKFKFRNLQLLNLSGNNIKSLKFLDNLNFVNEQNETLVEEGIPLEEIYLNDGDIEKDELIHFKKFKNLKRIELNNNNIKDLDDLNYIHQLLKPILKANNKKCIVIVNGNIIEFN